MWQICGEKETCGTKGGLVSKWKQSSGHDTRVLLLSATPYKLYSTLEEIDENQLDEHYAEFFQVMNFLFDDEVKDIKFKEVWKNYSHALSELKAGDSAIIRMKELAENAMYLSIISICRSQQLSLILLMADAGMIIPIGRMYLNTVKMAVFRQ